MKRIFLPITLIFLGIFAVIAFQLFGADVVKNVLNWESVKKLRDMPFVAEMRKEVNLPGGLRGGNAPEAHLTQDGVIEWTNRHRAESGQAALTENELLNISAQKKLEDMFQKQYFAHDAPDGTTPGQVIESVGYEYITTGENLALGNFADDQELVQAWMDSPGHRENILKDRYTEIGVAVGKGMYEGQETWIAVQHFGKPLSSCPQVDESQKALLDQKTEQATALQQEIDRQKQELESAKPESKEEADEYNRKVEEHNRLVGEYNALIEEIKNMTANYNSQVNAFNACANE